MNKVPPFRTRKSPDFDVPVGVEPLLRQLEYCQSSIDVIRGQLADQRREMKLSRYEYEAWKMKAQYSLNCRLEERAVLEHELNRRHNVSEIQLIRNLLDIIESIESPEFSNDELDAIQRSKHYIKTFL